MTKKALLIGINRYRIPGADLRGCVNDVKGVHGVLTQTYGFKKSDIKILLDYDATKKAIETGIKQLVAGHRSGDVLLLHYSGHGANVPDRDGDEADSRDEILCPTDLDWKSPLTDDWLRRMFDLLKPDVNLTVIMDCCHSGTNTRQFVAPDAPVISRYLPSPWDLVATESGRPLRGKKRIGLSRASVASRATKDIVHASIPELLITGCRDTQTSADAYIGGSFNGALTHSLVSAIRTKRGKLSYRDLHADTRAALRRGGFAQVPQLEGQKQRFDLAFLAPID